MTMVHVLVAAKVGQPEKGFVAGVRRNTVDVLLYGAAIQQVRKRGPGSEAGGREVGAGGALWVSILECRIFP